MPVYEITIGGVAFATLTAPDEPRYALECPNDAPQYAWQKAAASGADGSEAYNHGFRGQVIHPKVAYIGETCEADMNTDLAAWGGQEVTIETTAATYEHCLFQSVESIDKQPGCYQVTLAFEQQKFTGT